jgi:hypothetical protein
MLIKCKQGLESLALKALILVLKAQDLVVKPLVKRKQLLGTVLAQQILVEKEWGTALKVPI